MLVCRSWGVRAVEWAYGAVYRLKVAGVCMSSLPPCWRVRLQSGCAAPARLVFRLRRYFFTRWRVGPQIIFLQHPAHGASRRGGQEGCPGLLTCLCVVSSCLLRISMYICLCTYVYTHMYVHIYIYLWTNVRSFSYFLFLRHRIICWPGTLPKG